MRFHVVTLFPDSLKSYLASSIVKRAIEDGLVDVRTYNPKDYAEKKNGKLARIDKRPYGGGPGMVLQVVPVARAIEAALKKSKNPKKTVILNMSPRGEQLNGAYAQKLSKKYEDVILVCGRYEGIDERIKKIFKIKDLAVGEAVVTGGELPALFVIDAVTRRLDGAIGDSSSIEETRTASAAVYTRPDVVEWKGKKYKVPKLLLGGHHKEIEKWRGEN